MDPSTLTTRPDVEKNCSITGLYCSSEPSNENKLKQKDKWILEYW